MNRDTWIELAPAGWKPLVQELDAALKEKWPDYHILQVKEKFGTLRFYALPVNPELVSAEQEEGRGGKSSYSSGDAEEFYELIHQCELSSASICELCGQPGTLGDRDGWWSTRCATCAPEGWISSTYACDHPVIVNDTCDTCGRKGLARLEHSSEVLRHVHPEGACQGEHCTIHNRSDHAMRAFPQQWREEKGIMERVCPHGVGHPDPDDYKMGLDPELFGVHGCDGCCGGSR